MLGKGGVNFCLHERERGSEKKGRGFLVGHQKEGGGGEMPVTVGFWGGGRTLQLCMEVDGGVEELESIA